ncbi:cancer-related nucleoside-triphosphatase isoform X1 [Lepisosteus oculatus]|nr:PREDICTED: cancer-related nucleoside-triphosphatase isoform X1 [Lepisosteus oculatus]XP_015218128.1 PREDICTED: cancer-related nucleoside-triphosphatase isoform X1 [Lepisosteus oculatus]XP_015218129.1 PREDICTED: cancer-related nucleoside-triphosphatase isoform X1 [Lepisosteus oculatus]
MFKHVFLTGPPGVGKTTLVQKASELLKTSGFVLDGFYTEEVREGGRRIGFDVVTFSGQRGILSRIGSGSGRSAGRREYTVGQYVVDLPSFENLALPLFRNEGSRSSSGKRVFVIDEIGKMELFSHSFIQAVRQTLDSPAFVILGTIPIPKGKPLGLVEEVRNRSDVKLFTVTKDNRDKILPQIVATLQDCLK